MTDEVTEKALEGVDGFFNKLTEAADVVTEKLIEVAPEAADAMLNLVQFKGGFYLVKGAVVLCVFSSVAYMSYRTGVKLANSEDAAYKEGEIGAMVFLTIAGCVLSFFTLLMFLDFYNWLSVLYPEGAIALKALEAVGIEL